MVWTGHGHHIPGTTLIPDDPQRPAVVDCGGPGSCYFCDEEIAERKAEENN